MFSIIPILLLLLLLLIVAAFLSTQHILFSSCFPKKNVRNNFFRLLRSLSIIVLFKYLQQALRFSCSEHCLCCVFFRLNSGRFNKKSTADFETHAINNNPWHPNKYKIKGVYSTTTQHYSYSILSTTTLTMLYFRRLRIDSHAQFNALFSTKERKYLVNL